MPEAVTQRVEKGVPDSPLGRFYREHIDLILKKDIEGILNQYTPDALLISSFSGDRKPLYFKGREQLREHFKGILGLKGLQVEIAFWRNPRRADDRRSHRDHYRSRHCQDALRRQLGAQGRQDRNSLRRNDTVPGWIRRLGTGENNNGAA